MNAHYFLLQDPPPSIKANITLHPPPKRSTVTVLPTSPTTTTASVSTSSPSTSAASTSTLAPAAPASTPATAAPVRKLKLQYNNTDFIEYLLNDIKRREAGLDPPPQEKPETVKPPFDPNVEKRLTAKLTACETKLKVLKTQVRRQQKQLKKRIPPPRKSKKRYTNLSRDSKHDAAIKLRATLQDLYPVYTVEDFRGLIDAAFPPPHPKFSPAETESFQRELGLSNASMFAAKRILKEKLGYEIFTARR